MLDEKEMKREQLALMSPADRAKLMEEVDSQEV